VLTRGEEEGLFVAGPYVVLYRAHSTEDGAPLGVRCVKYANLTHQPGTRGVAFVWYGEGIGSDGDFRHFGESFVTAGGGNDSALPGHAAHLPGNGIGQANAEPARLLLTVTRASSGPPARITVTGHWHEEWELSQGNVLTDYVSTLPPIDTGGAAFQEFTVYNRDGTPGHGIRCMLSSGSWLGAGQWRGVNYLHLGTYIGDPSADGQPVKFGVADICHQRGFCGTVPWGQMLVRPAPSAGSGAWEVLGLWTEEWTLRHPAAGWEPAAEVAALTVR
jgi:hypothetical protein